MAMLQHAKHLAPIRLDVRSFLSVEGLAAGMQKTRVDVARKLQGQTWLNIVQPFQVGMLSATISLATSTVRPFGKS